MRRWGIFGGGRPVWVAWRACAVVVPLALTLGPAAVRAAQTPKYDLRLSDRIGEVNRYRLTFEIEMRAEYPGAAASARVRRLLDALAPGLDLETSVEYTQRLADMGPDGTRTFEVRWHDYSFRGAVGDEEIPPPPGHAESVEELLAGPARIRTTPTGRTLEARYSHPDLERMAREMNEAMPTYLPERPVSVGDRWSSRSRFPIGLPDGRKRWMALELYHTLEEVEDGPNGPVAVIGVTGTYSHLQGAEELDGAAPMHVQASLEGSNRFEIERGRFAGGRYQVDMFAVFAGKEVELHLVGHANGRMRLVESR